MQLPFTIEQIELFMLVFIRVGAILFAAPIYGSSDIPAMAKAGLSLTVAWILLPGVPQPEFLPLNNIYAFAPAIGSEILVGLIIGLTARFVFEGVQLGGQLIGFQMGFGIVNVIDPVTGANFSIIAQVQNLLATLLFIATGMHRIFFSALSYSFTAIPSLQMSLSQPLLQWFFDLSSTLFVIALKIAAPVMATLLFSSLILGILAKIAPQIHIFIVAFPLKIAIGLFVVGLTLPMFSIVIRKYFSSLDAHYASILVLAGTQ